MSLFREQTVAILAFTFFVTTAGLSASAWASQSPATIVNALLSAWNAKDADKAAALMADDVVYFDVTVGKSQKGRDAARDNVIKMFMRAAPDLKWVMKGKPIVDGNGVAFEWNFSGTNTGAWGPDDPATNKRFSFDGVTFIRVKNGKITYQGDYYDGYSFQKQLGWIK